MSIVRFVAAALLLPGAVHASTTFNVTNSTCSGALVSSFTDGVSLSCTGDFSLDGGTIKSDTFISLSATGSLQLKDLFLSAQTITLAATDRVNVGPGNQLMVAGLNQPTTLPGAIVRSGSVLVPQQEISQHEIGQAIHWESFDIAGNATVHVQMPGTLHTGVVPEPEGLSLMVAGLLVIGLAARSHSKG